MVLFCFVSSSSSSKFTASAAARLGSKRVAKWVYVCIVDLNCQRRANICITIAATVISAITRQQKQEQERMETCSQNESRWTTTISDNLFLIYKRVDRSKMNKTKATAKQWNSPVLVRTGANQRTRESRPRMNLCARALYLSHDDALQSSLHDAVVEKSCAKWEKINELLLVTDANTHRTINKFTNDKPQPFVLCCAGLTCVSLSLLVN